MTCLHLEVGLFFWPGSNSFLLVDLQCYCNLPPSEEVILKSFKNQAMDQSPPTFLTFLTSSEDRTLSAYGKDTK